MVSSGTVTPILHLDTGVSMVKMNKKCAGVRKMAVKMAEPMIEIDVRWCKMAIKCRKT